MLSAREAGAEHAVVSLRSPDVAVLHALADALAEAGTTPVLSDNIRHELWNKFCGQSVFASITTLTAMYLPPRLTRVLRLS